MDGGLRLCAVIIITVSDTSPFQLDIAAGGIIIYAIQFMDIPEVFPADPAHIVDR